MDTFLLYILKKISGLLVKLRFSNVPKKYVYFIRDTYVCKALQVKDWFRDYILKKKYKVVSFNGEFAPELQFALPFAYWHHLNGTLKSTKSSSFTKELYFFSPDHSEVFTERTNKGNYNFEIPRILYSHDYKMGKWAAVPLKETYKNDVFVYDKPILIIANRYNMEWGGPPISFLSIEILDFIIKTLKNKYQIIYNRPKPKDIINDNSEIYELDEYSWIEKSHPEVLLMDKLYRSQIISANNYNHFQLCVYANSSHFISVHGGTATLASYFGGTNIIFSKQGPEHYFKCYHKLYPKFSGATILHAADEETLKKFVTENLATN